VRASRDIRSNAPAFDGADENIILANYWKAIRATVRLYSLFATQA